MSSGRYPVNETGMLLYSSTKLEGQYHTIEKDCHVETDHPFSSTKWTRVTFMLKDNDDTRIFLDNVRVPQIDRKQHFPPHYVLNSAKVINLASMSSLANMSSSKIWNVENIQLSDLSLWIDSESESWAERELPATLGTIAMSLHFPGCDTDEAFSSDSVVKRLVF